MIGVPMSSNSVHVSMVQTGCMKAEFDSTYPVHLNGIISPEEYRASIDRINRTISSNKILIILAIVFALCMIGGIIFFIVGGMKTVYSTTYGFSALFSVGIALTVFGSIFFSIGCCLVQFRRAEKVRRAIAEESRKYSSRSPTPCSWRLETTRNYLGGYGNHYHSQLVNCIVIDIGRSTVSGNDIYYSNQGTNEARVLFGQQENLAPPPYSGQLTGFCPQCGASRHDLVARFCSSCGQSFNKNK